MQIAQARRAVSMSMGATIAVETYSGEGAYGPVYATSAAVTCNVDATRRLVRNANGDEVVSELTLQVAAVDEVKFTPQSRVTVGTRLSTVLAVSPKTFRAQVVYVEVACS